MWHESGAKGGIWPRPPCYAFELFSPLAPLQVGRTAVDRPLCLFGCVVFCLQWAPLKVFGASGPKEGGTEEDDEGVASATAGAAGDAEPSSEQAAATGAGKAGAEDKKRKKRTEKENKGNEAAAKVDSTFHWKTGVRFAVCGMASSWWSCCCCCRWSERRSSVMLRPDQLPLITLALVCSARSHALGGRAEGRRR